MIWARLDGPDTGALLPEVVACSLQQGPKSGSMGPVCGVAAAVLAREDDIDNIISWAGARDGKYWGRTGCI